MSGKSALIVMIVAVFAVTFAIRDLKAQAAHASGPANAATGEKKAEEQFKNIQVLKGVPADQIIPTMQFITASLGVECEFCHVSGAFDKDDKKPKQTARKMMEMMFAINQDNFGGHRAVTCNSCHRGSTDPVAMEPPKPEDASAQNNGPAPEQLFDKYVQAIGGATAVDKVTSRVMKGQIEFGGTTMPIDIYSKEPDKRISLTHTQNGDNITAFDGHQGWLGVPGRPVREMHGGDLDGAAIDADLHLAAHLKEMFSDVRTEGTDKVGSHEAYLVVGQREGKPPIRLFFDTQSGLLVRMERFGETALGRLPTQIDYADYRDVSGVKIPYQWTLARPGGRFTIKLSDAKDNVPVDDAKFVKPAPPEEAPKGPGGQ